MQILGKRSKVLLMVIAIAMLIAVGVSFAMWDMSAIKATNGNLSDYANAKVGDIVSFGRYYQTGNRINNDENAEYEKTPIEWLVVDKDEHTGQLTLMSKYILACGSYFGNYYDDGTGYGWRYNNNTTVEVAGISYNQAYVDSTVRAYLNNLERLDMGGDSFDITNGYQPSEKNSTLETGLLSSVGFSNQKYWTGLSYDTDTVKDLVNYADSGLVKRSDNSEVYYRRPINSLAFTNRPVTKGFYDEAFTNEEKSLIAPKQIAGYTGYRWPDNAHDISTKSYIEGATDKVWIPSTTELNIMEGMDWNGESNDSWTNPSDESSSTVFEYCRNYANYRNPYNDTRNNTSLSDAIVAKRTQIASNGMVGNFSIPVYDKGTTIAKTAISSTNNTSGHYWTRSPLSIWFNHIRIVQENIGGFSNSNTLSSHIGVRPCIILKY